MLVIMRTFQDLKEDGLAPAPVVSVDEGAVFNDAAGVCELGGRTV